MFILIAALPVLSLSLCAFLLVKTSFILHILLFAVSDIER